MTVDREVTAHAYIFFFSSRRRHTRSVSAFLLNRSSDLVRAGNTDVFFCVSKNVSVSCAYTQGKREQFSGFNRTLDAINRSEERRVGKECRARGWEYRQRNNGAEEER